MTLQRGLRPRTRSHRASHGPGTAVGVEGRRSCGGQEGTSPSPSASPSKRLVQVGEQTLHGQDRANSVRRVCDGEAKGRTWPRTRTRTPSLEGR